MAKNNKPHYKIPLPPLLNNIPPFQRAGSITTTTPVKGKPVAPKVYTPPKPSAKREDFLDKHTRKPLVQYTALAWDSMNWLVDNCPIELGWVGAVEQVNQWHYIIHDLRVMEQEATGATFEYEDWNDAVTEMLVKKTMRPGRVDANLGHSHVNMGVTPSGTDEGQMMELAHFDKDDKPTAKFSIQTIVNKSGLHHCAIYDWEHGVHYDNVGYEVLTCLTDEHIADLEMQLKRVKRKVYTYGGAMHGHGTYGAVSTGFNKKPLQGKNTTVTAAAAYQKELDDQYLNEDPNDPFDNPMLDLWDDEALEDFESGFDISQCNIRLVKRLNDINDINDINYKGNIQ